MVQISNISSEELSGNSFQRTKSCLMAWPSNAFSWLSESEDGQLKLFVRHVMLFSYNRCLKPASKSLMSNTGVDVC